MNTNKDLSGEDQKSLRPLMGRLLAIDYGTRRVGLAVSDELGVSVRPLPHLKRTNWKKLLLEIISLCERFDARAVVIGLPLHLDNSEGEMAIEIRHIARNLQLSLGIPVYLQDEKLTSQAAAEMLREAGCGEAIIAERIDSEAAAIILRDYINNLSAASDRSAESTG